MFRDGDVGLDNLSGNLSMKKTDISDILWD